MLRTLDSSKARRSESPEWPSIALASSQLRRRRPPRLEGARVERPTLLRLGTIFVASERVVVSGSVSQEAAATAVLEINGQRVPICASGSFCATVELEGEPAVTLALETERRETIAMEIPLRACAARATGSARSSQAADETRCRIPHAHLKMA